LRTFIFANVLERVGGAVVFALDDADFAKSAFADDAEETEVIEVDLSRDECQRLQIHWNYIDAP
jgi:hypothetical protein